MSASASDRLRALGVELPPPPAPAGTYRPVVLSGGFAFVAGQIAIEGGQVLFPGRVGENVSPSDAQAVARRATLQALSALHAELGSLDRVRRIVRVVVYVASGGTFDRAHEVADGATRLLVEVFGEAGRPARAAVGVARLPRNAPVEVELLAEVA